MKYLLVGGGVASSAAVETIRAIDAGGSVLVLGREPVRPYHRSPLSKSFLRRERPRAELFAHDAEWFNAHNVALRTGRRVVRLDVTRQAAATDDGEEISYDRLLLATGAIARHLTIPGADLQNVFYLRTLADAEMLQNAIVKATAEGRQHDAGRGRVAVIGGGLLGLELASTFTVLGLHVDLIVGEEHPWHKIVGDTLGRFLARRLAARGVQVHLNQRPIRLCGDGRVQRVTLDAHEPACDFVVAAVGSVVSRELLRGTPIAAEKAILTNERCETNVPNVYSAGDCAALFDPLFGKHRWIDHSTNAIETGRIAGANMAGGDARYDLVNTFNSEVFDLQLTVWGSPKHIERRLIRGTPSAESPDFAEIGITADGRVAQVVSINGANEHAALRELIRTRANVSGREDALRDASSDLASL